MKLFQMTNTVHVGFTRLSLPTTHWTDGPAFAKLQYFTRTNCKIYGMGNATTCLGYMMVQPGTKKEKKRKSANVNYDESGSEEWYDKKNVRVG